MKNTTYRGFTIVELLIVIVVIAILAAIGIVGYRAIQSRANDAAVTNDLAQMKRKLELFNIATGKYPAGGDLAAVSASSPDPLSILFLRVSKNSYAVSPVVSYNFLLCYKNSNDFSQYAVVAQSKSGKRFKISNTDSAPVEYTGPWVTTGSNPQDTMCQQNFGSDDQGQFNHRGYAAEDTTNGPWRSSVGGN